MQSPLLWIGALVFCAGALLALAHEQLKGPDNALWLDWLGLAVIVIGMGTMITGGMLSATG